MNMLNNLMVGILAGLVLLGLLATVVIAAESRSDLATFWMGLLIFLSPNSFRFIWRLA